MVSFDELLSWFLSPYGILPRENSSPNSSPSRGPAGVSAKPPQKKK